VPVFREMDPEKIRELLKGHEDVLTPAVRADEERLRRVRCTCGGTVQRTLDPKQAYLPGALTPNWQASCLACGKTFPI